MAKGDGNSITKALACFSMMLITLGVVGQGRLQGTVTDGATDLPVESASVVIDSQKGTNTDQSGNFVFTSLTAGEHQVAVSIVGYAPWKSSVIITDGEVTSINVELVLSYIEAGEIVVSATRTENAINNIPARVNVVSPKAIRATPALVADDYLAMIPGINISRSFGILSHKATVTMRGLSGKEQARVLVMIDGIPVNKADGGSVNWNLLDPEVIERIEVVKGPASAVYGSNAMGGAINIMTRKPAGKLSGIVKAGYGTYNTFTGRLNLSQHAGNGNDRGFYYSLNAFHRQSDGYITQSPSERMGNPYIIPSNVRETSASLKTGYDFSRNKNLELDFIYYDDERGTGEKVYKHNGNTVDHDTYQVRARYRTGNEKSKGDISVFWLKENYKKVNEYMKDDYTWYDVLSNRLDAGFLSSVSFRPPGIHSVTAGLDVKLGSVDAYDMYYTSTDVVYNKGKMLSSGLYVQDELTLLEEKMHVVAGIRYDLAQFFDGVFYIDTPSGETSYMNDIVDRSMDNKLWQALSPRISASYSVSSNIRIYTSFGRGYRPSVLDDLCRSGRVKGGFKLANPEVVPESLLNIETGCDFTPGEKMKATVSAYYSAGKNFLYYVNTGDSIELSNGLRPIFVSTNIPMVRIVGIEAEMRYSPVKNISFTGSYGYSYSVISEYAALDEADPIDLTGKHLTDVPSHIFAVAGQWNNKICNLSLRGRFQSSMWVNDLNVFDDIVGADKYPSYFTLDLQLYRQIRFMNFTLGIQNLLDKEYYDSGGDVCPGRFITFEAGVRF